ncbi:PTS sugar transporter subunit IIA [Melghirimyces algeriensis]|uniref:PTS system IIA component, Gat family n=1 Tax=Melghirimyces algeriensis TaxID=910412 RepID=A0A521CHK6_9BACL|nr:PTS sugar transporter subunit IIA [Melghirimyces algeriensis]SMO58190.1 PTS system IIA component, Gat family [Melghirimyces algeriensis]
MEALQSLFTKELIFTTDDTTQKEVFTKISKILLERGLVNKEFTEALMERERHYPTGIDLSPVATGLPNAAIPHTEAEFCNGKVIAFVKLKHEIPFKNMIAPDQEIDVKYLFFIINHEKSNQSQVLSDLMAIMTNEERMRALETSTSKDEIYHVLKKECF